MVKSLVMLCVEKVIIDRESNNTSLLSVLENIRSVAFPLYFPKFDVFNLLQRLETDPERIEVNLRIYNNETVLLNHAVRVDFQGKLRNRLTVHINGLAISNPGLLKATLFLGDAELGSYELKVDLVDALPVAGRN